MGDQANARHLSAAFPSPPPFYNHFTKANRATLRQIRKDTTAQAERTDDQQPLDPDTLPIELQYLIPPLPPADGRYKSFGVQHDLNASDQSLSESGIQQLYPEPAEGTSPDPTPHLLTMTRSILLNFLELVGILSVNPADYEQKVEHLQTLFYNVHHLINQYRPHQARESLILMMEEHLDKVKAEIAAVKEGKETVQGLLDDVHKTGETSVLQEGTEGIANGHATTVDAGEKARKEVQRAQWAELQEELG